MDYPRRLLLWLQLPADETGPAQARDALTALRPLLDGLFEDALIVVNELVTNAVRHAGVTSRDRIDIRVYQGDQRLRIEVSDGGSGFVKPPLTEMAPDRDHGWGLAMVDALTESWGVETGETSTVWMEMESSMPSRPTRPAVSADLTRSLVDAALEALMTIDELGIVLDWNQTATEVFGYPREDAMGREIWDLIFHSGEESGLVHRMRSDLSATEESFAGRPIELSLKRRDGTSFPAQVRLLASDLESAQFFHISVFDASAQKRSEEATAGMLASLVYLADASEVLASSLDVDRTLRRLARLVVPTHADWCTINLVEEDGSIRRVAAEHADAARAAELARLLDAHPNEPDSESGVARTIRTGEAQLFAEVDDALLAETANDPEYLEITAQLQIRSCVIAPLEARGRVLGSISLVYTEQEKSYDDADLALARDLGRRAGLAIDNARLYEQRDNIAIMLQRSLLPPYLPQIPDFELAARYEPAGTGNEVGGDFYDVFEAAGGWNLVVGDVEGKGPAAAALIGLARHTLRAIAVDHPSPADALINLNRVLMSSPSELCCTVALCRLVLDDGKPRMLVARAGHPAPFLVRRVGAVEMLGKDGTLLGAVETPMIHEHSIGLDPGDSIVLMTDGVIGSRALTDRSIVGLLSELANKPADQIADELSQAARRAQPGGLDDDIAILVARSTGSNT